MPKGGELRIETANVDLDHEAFGDDLETVSGPHVAIAVTDTGSGMDAETLSHVFEPFFTIKDVGKGSGMGLSMVYGFAVHSGGHVAIYSEEGKGTTVRLYFPAAGKGSGEMRGKEEETKRLAKGNETILVVEDDEEARQVTSEMLEKLGYLVLEAEDGPSALTLLRNRDKQVVLVFSDVVMPSGMSGLDLARELKVCHQDMKILLVSGYSEKSIGAEDLDETGITLLRKPCEFAKLAQTVRHTLDK